MTRSLLSTFTFLLFLASQVRALTAIQGSPCFNTCNGSSAATASDIVCTDSDFTNTTKGQLMEKCLSCLHGSSYKSSFMTDSILFLYYIATAQQTCLSGSLQPPISTCSSKCSSISGSFSNLGGKAFFTNSYAYCSANQSSYTNQAPDCASCLQSQSGSVILGNFVYVGNYACTEQPSLSDGQSIDYAGSLFSYTPISSSSVSTTSTVSGLATTRSFSTAVSSSTTHSPSTSPSSSSSSSTHSSTPSAPSATGSGSNGAGSAADSGELSGSTTKALKPGVAAAIGIIVGLFGVAAIVGLAILARRHEKARSFQRMDDNSGSQAKTEPNLTISNKAAALGATVEGLGSTSNRALR